MNREIRWTVYDLERQLRAAEKSRDEYSKLAREYLARAEKAEAERDAAVEELRIADEIAGGAE